MRLPLQQCAGCVDVYQRMSTWVQTVGCYSRKMHWQYYSPAEKMSVRDMEIHTRQYLLVGQQLVV